MKELEIMKSTKDNRLGRNKYSLFNKKNHRCNNRKATYEELKNALDNWQNNETVKFECPIPFLDDDPEIILKRCLLKTETLDDKVLIVSTGEDWKNTYEKEKVCMWNKVVFYNKSDKQFYLRSYTTISERKDGAILKSAIEKDWYVDLSTIRAPSEFWQYLKENLENLENPENPKRDFWKGLESINDRKEIINILKNNLTDEEKIFLCECI